MEATRFPSQPTLELTSKSFHSNRILQFYPSNPGFIPLSHLPWMDGVRATSLPLIHSSAIKKQKVKPTNEQKNEPLTFVVQSWQVTHLEVFTTIFFLAYSLVPFSSAVEFIMCAFDPSEFNTTHATKKGGG